MCIVFKNGIKVTLAFVSEDNPENFKTKPQASVRTGVKTGVTYIASAQQQKMGSGKRRPPLIRGY
jgi:hypothetical protein